MKAWGGIIDQEDKVAHYTAQWGPTPDDSYIVFKRNVRVPLDKLRHAIMFPYSISKPEGGWRSLDSFSEDERAFLHPYAVVLAALDSNAFIGECTEQYIPEVYEILHRNGCLAWARGQMSKLTDKKLLRIDR